MGVWILVFCPKFKLILFCTGELCTVTILRTIIFFKVHVFCNHYNKDCQKPVWWNEVLYTECSIEEHVYGLITKKLCSHRVN